MEVSVYKLTFPFEFIALLLVLSGNFAAGIILFLIATTIGYLLWKNEEGL